MARWSQRLTEGELLELIGAQCHWPGCGHPLTMRVNGKPVLDAEIAHIRARRPGGRRSDSSWPPEQLDGPDNLLLLCAPHHKVIDGADADAYPVELLESWKQNHLSAASHWQDWRAGTGEGHHPAPGAWRSWPTVAELDALAAGVRPSWEYGGNTLPAYVPRDLDQRLTDLLAQARTQGGMVLVTGDTACGKSRLALEAARRALPDHLVCQVPMGGLQTAITAVMHCPAPRLLWLDGLEQHDRLQGLDIAELRRYRIPVLATVHVQHLPPLTASHRTAGGNADAVLSTAVMDQASVVFVDRAWSQAEMQRARITSDPRVRSAAEQCIRRGVSEFLAAGPALRARWQAAWRIGGNPRGAALVRGALDLARTGLRGPLPDDLLTRTHRYYLADAGGDLLRPEPLEEAFAWADDSRVGMTGLLQPAAGGARRPFAGLLGEAPAQPAESVHPLVWFEALGGAHDARTAWTVASNAQREQPSIATRLWRILREAGLTSVLWHQAATLIQDDRCEEALQFLSEHTDPADAFARRLTAVSLTELDRLDEAETTCREAHALGDTDSLADLAQILAQRGHLDEAERVYQRAAQAGARDAWFNLGVLLADRGKTRQAIDAYKRAASADDRDALANLGRLLADTGKTRAAEAALREATDLGDHEAQLNLANLLKRLCRTDEALKVYQQLIEHGDARAWINLGNLHADNDQPIQAEHAYRQALEAGLSIAHYYLGRHLAAEQRWHHAAPHLRHAVNTGATDAGLHLGLALKELGETQEAKNVLSAAARAGDPLAAVAFAAIADETDADERRALLRQAVDSGDPDATLLVMLDLEHAGHLRRAKALRRRLADCGDPVTAAVLAAYSPSPVAAAC
ncbi:tetratricopeptide repeat protein [Kitasatospora sp. RG8]|uniref:tetratricopeptide repeat protein n=1 Tax=Kitasatospora sp. RG8 TaxID=2820815 RepID=UPI001ADF2578|nr:tetratricopeptide repeat protein [Kitasatospora sp. RG8]MBP0451144.1 tetratricopeptide repeat protein [Kitasatospora sp. RG8]